MMKLFKRKQNISLREIEFYYRWENDDGRGKVKGKFHTWFNNSNELYFLVENEKGEIRSYNYSDCSDVKFIYP